MAGNEPLDGRIEAGYFYVIDFITNEGINVLLEAAQFHLAKTEN